MSSADIINQPIDGQLGELVIRTLNSGLYDSLTLCVAFAKNSGVLRLKEHILSHRKRGGTVRIFVGVDLNGTSYEALCNLHEISDELWVTHVESDQTFHPKIYDFRNSLSALVAIGSNNLTNGGLWMNFETSSILTLSNDDSSDVELQLKLDSYYNQLKSGIGNLSMRIKDLTSVDRLRGAGYVEEELMGILKRKEATDKVTRVPKVDKFFPSAYPATFPSIDKKEKNSLNGAGEPSENSSPGGPPATVGPSLFSPGKAELFWFESRKLTGGSRNQVDLSMKARIIQGAAYGTKYELDGDIMKGGIVYFGLNPEQDDSKMITINFEGIDYYPNKIYYPEGEHANGTWRLQINGRDSSGTPITRAMENKYYKEYLTEKVLVFDRISDDYYGLTVLPESTLEKTIAASALVAKNGSGYGNTKRFGLLQKDSEGD